MLTVTLTEFTLGEVLETIADLRAQGYKQGVDFDFTYYPEKVESDDFVYHTKQQRKLEFTFYNEHLGLIFQLGR